MRRHLHKGLAALLCMCLLISYAPLPASAEGGNTVTASTDVQVLTIEGFAIYEQTPDFAATADEAHTYELKVAFAGGTAPYSYAWSRTANGQPDAAFADGGTTSETALSRSLAADTFADESEYAYTVEITDAAGKTARATIEVVVSDEYAYRTLSDGDVGVAGYIHKQASLSAYALESDSATYAHLQHAAEGALIVGAWHAVVAGAPDDKPALVGKPEVTLPALGVPDGATVQIVGLDASGALTSYSATASSGTVTFVASALGAFAVAYDHPDKLRFTIEASAGEGGQITPLGTGTFAEGASQTYVVLPDSGYVVDEVLVDDEPASLAGNTYTFDAIDADHRIAVSFVQEPRDASLDHALRVRVSGGHGMVSVAEGEPDASVDAIMTHGSPTEIELLPDEGYTVGTFTVNGVAHAVLGTTYLLPCMTEDAEVEVTFAPGATPPLPMHSVQTEVLTEGGSISPESATVPHGRSASFAFLPEDGYELAEVKLNGADVTHRVEQTDGATLSLENIVCDHALSASFAEKEEVTHTVVVEAGEGGSASPLGASTVVEGSNLSVYLFPDAGFELAGVTLAGVGGEAVDVTDRVSGGVFVLADVREDCRVHASFARTTVAPPEDTFFAITATAGPGGSISPAGTTRLAAGGSQTFYFIPDEGFKLDAVTVDGVKVEPAGLAYTLLDVRANAAVHATFAALEPGDPDPEVPAVHTIDATAGPGGTISPNGAVSVLDQGSMQFAFIPFAGFELEQVLVDGSPVAVQGNPYRFDGVIANHAIAASFKAKAGGGDAGAVFHTVSASAGEGGTLSPAGDVLVADGGSQTYSFIPNDGYAIDEVTVNGTSVQVAGNAYTLFDVKADMRIAVSFKAEAGAVSPETYSIASSSSAGGFISPDGSTAVVKGGSLSFAFAPFDGYELYRVVVDGTDVPLAEVADGSYRFDDVSAAHAIRALFAKEGTVPVDPDDPDKPVDPDTPDPDVPAPAYATVHASAGAGGSISPAGDVRVAYGSAQMFLFEPDDGYTLDEVTVDGQKVEPAGFTYTMFGIKADAAIHATFRSLEPGEPDPELPVVYTISSSAGTGGSISPAGEVRMAAGGSVLYTFTADAGFELDTVKVDGVDVTATIDTMSYRFRDLADNHTIEAAFAPASGGGEDPLAFHTVTASAGEGGTVSPSGAVKVPEGQSQTFFFLPDAGKKVSSITVDGRTFAFTGSSYTLFGVKADTTIRVEFADAEADDPVVPVVTHTVTASVEGSGGSVSPEGPVTVLDGGSLLVTFVPDEGFEANEVKVDGTAVQLGGTSYRLANVRADASVTVSFKRADSPAPDNPFVNVNVKVEVSADGGKGGLVSPSGSLVMAHGSSQTFYVFPHEGFDLDAVYVNDEPVTVQPLAPVTLFSARSAAGAGGGYSFVIDSVTQDTLVRVAFKKLADGDPVPPPVTAHAVSASAGSGGMISPSGTSYVADGGSLTYTLKADAGYHLDTLSVGDVDVTDQVAGSTYALSGVAGDTTVHATFAADPVAPDDPTYATVRATAGAGGSISPAGGIRVKKGESIPFVLLPDAGYTVDEVTVNGNPVVPIDFTYTLFDVTGDTEVAVTFRALAPDEPEPVLPTVHAITASATTGGSVSPSGDVKVAQGYSALFTFEADAGFELSAVEVDGAPVAAGEYAGGSYRFQNVTEDHALRAVFAPKKSDPPAPEFATVTATASAGGSIDPAGEMQVPLGESRTFTMTPESGYALDTLTVDGRTFEYGGETYTLFDIKADASIHAAFKKVGGSDPDPGPGPGPGPDPVDPDDPNGPDDPGTDPDPDDPDDPGTDPKPVGEFFAIEVTAVGHGTVSDLAGASTSVVKVAKGASKTFSFLPEAGYVVGSVKADGVEVPAMSHYTFTDVRADHTLEVAFEAQGAPVPNGPGQAISRFAQTGDAPLALASFAISLAAIAAGIAAAIAWRRSLRRERTVRR